MRYGLILRRLPLLAGAAVVFLLGSCSRGGDAGASQGGGEPAGAEEPATPPPVELPEPESTPGKEEFVHDKTAQVSILGYHRFELKPRDPLALSPAELEAQCRQIVEAGIPVISMQDFLAWRRGEKNIPPRSVVITIDDGYDCTYEVARPIFEKFGFPFTVFLYTNFIDAGGRSMTWEELAELRDAGVEIGSHSVSHSSLSKRRGRSDAEFDAFLRDELGRSKALLEEKLGIQVRTFAYPYGQYGKEAQRIGRELGYEALFTVNGQISDFQTPADTIGRFVIQSTMPEIFQAAIKFKSATFGMENYANAALPPEGGGKVVGSAPGVDIASSARGAAQMQVSPADHSTVTDRRPLLSADLSALGEVDPASIEMRLSGMGALPFQWDAATRTISCKVPESLRPQTYTVSVVVGTGAAKRNIEWSFAVK